jgi:hypothetical protein
VIGVKAVQYDIDLGIYAESSGDAKGLFDVA